MTQQELKQSGKHREYEFIHETFKKGNLSVSGYKITTEELFSELRTAIRLISEIYEDSWDLDFILQGDKLDLAAFLIHFPDFEIKNSRKKKHRIKNLFVRSSFKIVSGEKGTLHLAAHNLRGVRTTHTRKEWNSDYSHSHLRGVPTESLPKTYSFCTGSGEINIYTTQLLAGEFSEELFMKFLVQIMSLVTWESLEGTPHRYIERINSAGSDTSSGRRFGNYGPAQAKYVYQLAIDHHKLRGITPALDFTMSGGEYSVINNEKLITFLKSGLVNSEDRSAHLCYQDANGTYWRYMQLPGMRTDGSEARRLPGGELIFREVSYRAEFEETEQENTEEQQEVQYSIHQMTVACAKTIIDNDINRKKIRKSTVDRY